MRNGMIDFMRFVFIIAVVLHHSVLFYAPIIDGYIGVEFFFIVSGYLLTKKVLYLLEHSTYSAADVVISKVKAFYPAFLVSTMIAVLLRCTFVDSGGIEYLLGDLLLLQMFHFPVYSATGVMWYLSAMMAAILLLLVFLPKHYNIFSSVIAPFIVLSIYGFLYSKFHSVAVILEPFDSDGMFCAGIFRALAGMGAGVISYRVSQYMSHVNFMSLGIKIITLVEFLSYAMAFGISVRLAGNTEYNFLMVLFIFVGITLSFSGKSYSAKWFSSDIFNKLGKFSLYIFLNHFYIALVLASMGMAHRDISMIIYLLGTLLCSNVAKFITDRIMSLEMYKMFIMPNK